MLVAYEKIVSYPLGALLVSLVGFIVIVGFLNLPSWFGRKKDIVNRVKKQSIMGTRGKQIKKEIHELTANMAVAAAAAARDAPRQRHSTEVVRLSASLAREGIAADAAANN